MDRARRGSNAQGEAGCIQGAASGPANGTRRDRLPVDLTAHFGAQLPMLVSGLYYEGWDPSKVPIKMARQEFLDPIQQKIVTDRVIDPRIPGGTSC